MKTHKSKPSGHAWFPWFRAAARVDDSLCAGDISLGTFGAPLGVFLIKGNSFRFAHPCKFDIDSLKKFSRKRAEIIITLCNSP